MIMPHPSKRQRLTVIEANLSVGVTAGDVSVDVLAIIFAFLGVKDIMLKRRVCKKWKEAVKMTIVPTTDFCVDSMEEYNVMRVMATELPNLQQITIGDLGYRHKWSDGEDPYEERASQTADWTSHDIGIISNFRKLRRLNIYTSQTLNGRYPSLFNFPLLQVLDIDSSRMCKYLKWDLEMIAALPLLKELTCAGTGHLTGNECVTGNINSLRVLKGTLEKVAIDFCPGVKGSFMDLADFPHLKVLNLFGTAVTGDIRDINANDFSALECLDIPKGVYGGRGYELQSISDAPGLMRTLYLFNKQRPNLIDSLLPTLPDNSTLFWELVEDSPDWYAAGEEDTPPFFIGFVKAGSRLGYRWETDGNNPCEVNWLDPEPDRDSSDYDEYIEELEQINSKVHMFRGFHQPPPEEEYYRLLEEYNIDD